MPRKKTHQPPPVFEDFPDPDETSPSPLLPAEPELDPEFHSEPRPEPPRTGRKKNRNAQTTVSRLDSSSPEALAPQVEELGLADPSRSPLRHPSLLSQIAFPPTKSKPVDIREDLVASEKVSDQYTPPSDEGIHEGIYGLSPHSVAVSSPANTPPVAPGFSRRPSSKPQSPRISPLPRNARPMSFGGSIPPLPGYSRYPGSTYGSPPAPHLPQPHFYGAQDIDLGLPKPPAAVAPSPAAFTKFTSPNDRSRLVLTGYEGRLTIAAFDGNCIEEIGALQALPGICVDAEILEWADGVDPYANERPLVAVTLRRFDAAANGAESHIFSVSVYSLAQRKHVRDLLTLPPQPAQPTTHGSLAISTSASNHLHLTASGNYLAIASGRTGEVFLFCPVLVDSTPRFECLAKLWTSIQPREQRRDASHHRITTPEYSMSQLRSVKLDDDIPMLSMCGRWLAICPPTISSQHIGAQIDEHVVSRPYSGLETTSAAARPQVNCEVDSPDADTLLGKVARGFAQEVVKVSKWVGDRTMQYWGNYWQQDVSTNANPTYNPQNMLAYNVQAGFGNFPPTHAEMKPVTKDPEIVSIFDLKATGDPARRKAGAMAPFATFKPPHGCSFLSFAPNGLMLLTASRNGDYQYVWDLFETKYNRAPIFDFDGDNQRAAPKARQLARFDRLSSSVIVDVAWESPCLSRLAILTKNKTVHLFDLPASAMRWPPPRKAKKARPISAPPNAANDIVHDDAPSGGFLASAISIAGRTQPILANLKGRTPSASGGFAGIGQAGFGIATATGARGSRAVATGLSKSLGAATETVSRIQHAGENRLHVKSDQDIVAGSLCWIRRSSKAGICVLNEQGIRYWQVRKSRSREARQRETTVFEARKAVSFRSADVQAALLASTDKSGRSGFWRAQPSLINDAGHDHPLSFAEIDTNAPFQPFHSDQRVTISVVRARSAAKACTDNRAQSKRATAAEQWVFGDHIYSTPLVVHAGRSLEEDQTGSVIYRESSIANVAGGPADQTAGTSGRRNTRRGGTALPQGHGHDDDLQEGFFEDDCDVLDFASDPV